MTRNPLASIPSIEQLLQRDDMRELVHQHGHQQVRDALRKASQALRATTVAQGMQGLPDDIDGALAMQAASSISAQQPNALRPMFNLSGTVLHTNLGRALLATPAIEAMTQAAQMPANVEFSLEHGRRGERDEHVEALLTQLTGAQAATVVNNNAAAVMLCLNALAAGKEVPVSRGELVEIGGSFRMPQIMASAGCKLVEVGTTNRTHLSDYEQAIGDRTAALMTVDPSNYVIEGFTSQLKKADIADIAHKHHLPLIDDLGSGSLINLTTLGLPHETTVQQALSAGADVVTFSGDKLLGGPQAGIIVGRQELIDKIRRSPMKRAMRLDKLRLAAMRATLQLYLAPERLPDTLPTLRLLTRKKPDIEPVARRIATAMRSELDQLATFEVIDCLSQIGSGALPADVLPSSGIAITPVNSSGAALTYWSQTLLGLGRPVLGRIHKDQLVLDMRTMHVGDEAEFVSQLPALKHSLTDNNPASPC